MIGHILGVVVVALIWTAVLVAAWFEADFRRDPDNRFARRHRCRVEPSRINQVRRDPSPRPKQNAS